MGIWDGRVVDFIYTNHRGVTEYRRAVPTGLSFEVSTFYPDEGKAWFVVAWCLDRQAERRFLLSRMGMIERSEDQSLPWRKE
jgi:predicted DNA-binding transcriptional regulator YafY